MEDLKPIKNNQRYDVILDHFVNIKTSSETDSIDATCNENHFNWSNFRCSNAWNE